MIINDYSPYNRTFQDTPILKEEFGFSWEMKHKIENNTWVHRDMEFLFECSNQYISCERSERVR